MYYSNQNNRSKSIKTETFVETGMAYYATTPNKYLEKKTYFPEKYNDSGQQRKVISTIEPLTFSNKIGIKKRANYSKEVSTRSKNSYSNKGSFLNTSNSGSQIGYTFVPLKKQNENLKAEQAILLSRILQSEKSFQKLNKNYVLKCEQSQTLKSIITSLKGYIHHQLSQNSEQSVCSENSIRTKQNNPHCRKSKQHKKRLSQLSATKRVSINLNGLLNQVSNMQQKREMLTKFDSFIRKQSVESIKGSAYQLYSFKEMI